MGNGSVLSPDPPGWSKVEPRNAYKYTHKHQFSIKNNWMCGMTLPQLFKVVYRYGRGIDWFNYGFRVFFLTSMATINTMVAIFETLLYGTRIRRQALNTRPIFIIGHPRTGTTLIHNILSKDPRLSYCSTFQCGFPSTFLLMEWAKPYIANMIDDTRPMDNMDLHMDLPQEDELATAMLSGGVSPYMCLGFMKQSKRFWDYFHFRGASRADFDAWRTSFLFFLKKVTFRAGGSERRMVIKSPVHTARVKLLLEIFPDAQFIYVHRNPYHVCLSASHMADAYYPYCYLSKPTNGEVNDFIFNQYELMHDEYVATRVLIPKDNLVEIRFEDLEKDPVKQLQRTYRLLGMQWHASDPSGEVTTSDRGNVHVGAAEREQQGWAESYVEQLKGFKKNSFPSGLSAEMHKLVTSRWSNAFEDFRSSWSENKAASKSIKIP